MLGFLRGRILEKEKGKLLIDVGGIGFEVYVPQRLEEEPEVEEGDSISLYIHTHFYSQELKIQFFGFKSKEERDLFRVLVNVPSVGTKLALSILSTFSFPELAGIILSGDANSLVRARGVGRKMAEMLIVELKDKMKNITVEDMKSFSILNDVTSALVSLDYGEGEARKLAKKALELLGDNATLEELIAKALSLSRQRR